MTEARRRISSGGPWEASVGRAVVVGDACWVSGTTDAGPDGRSLHPGDAGAQARAAWEIVATALAGGFSLAEVVRTRTFVVSLDDVLAVHGELFGEIRPRPRRPGCGLIEASLRSRSRLRPAAADALRRRRPAGRARPNRRLTDGGSSDVGTRRLLCSLFAPASTADPRRGSCTRSARDRAAPREPQLNPAARPTIAITTAAASPMNRFRRHATGGQTPTETHGSPIVNTDSPLSTPTMMSTAASADSTAGPTSWR